ncbi:MAG: DUF2259 domain-containing protein [Hyphomicrobiales bacterium]|nr:DUF2259 domain-containing protein [Hyphomicrobiales bacterium]
MKRIAIALLLALTLAGTMPGARAGDGAALHVLGFSPDGRYFAFEQYGEQNASGTFYSTITAIEIASNRLVKGMPLMAVIDPDHPMHGKEPRDKQLGEIRAQAAAQAAAQLRQLGISEPGQPVASARDSQARSLLDQEQVRSIIKALVASLTLPADRFGPGTRLVLREFDIALPRCKDLGAREHPNGFGLTLERRGRPTIHLSRDQTIPTSRGCPEHYGIVEAHALPLPDGAHALAVVIHYFYPGIEGLSRRFLAVTSRVAKP